LKLNRLRADITNDNLNLHHSRIALFVQPLVGPSLQRLLSKGLVEQDIVELVNILFEGSLSNSDSSINTNKQSLIEDLKKYGSIISTTQELNRQVDKLKNQIDELQERKRGLEAHNQKIISILANSEIVVKFLNGSDDSIGNDKENVKILAIMHLFYIPCTFVTLG
jgi:hypothetical protein